MDKEKKEEEEADLKEKVVATSIGQLVDHIKQIGLHVTLTIAI
jgi:hypothetical protein